MEAIGQRRTIPKVHVVHSALQMTCVNQEVNTFCRQLFDFRVCPFCPDEMARHGSILRTLRFADF